MDKKKLNKILLIASQVFFGLFIVLIILLLTVDRKEVGPDDAVIGLSTINVNIFSKLGFNPNWEKVSKYLGYFAIFICCAFGVIGLIQWITRKKFLAVDVEICLLGVFYIICIIVYVFFSVISINYRPILVLNSANEFEMELSFPSSHTILGVFVFCSAALVLPRYVKIKCVLIPSQVMLFGLAILMMVSRLISGVHWFTDILGAFLLSGFLLLMFLVLLNINVEYREKREKGIEA